LFAETRLVGRLDNGGLFLIPLNEDGSFTFTPDLAFDGSGNGAHVVELFAQTRGGEVGNAVVPFTLVSSPQSPLTIDLNGGADPGNDFTATWTAAGDPVSIVSPDITITGAPTGQITSAIATLVNPLTRPNRASAPTVQFLVESANLYQVNRHSQDQGRPILPLYTDFGAGGVYGQPGTASFNIDSDGNDPDAAVGTSSFRLTWTGEGVNGFFDFGLGLAVPNRPRDLVDFGEVAEVRFFAKGDSMGQQARVKVFGLQTGGGFFEIMSQVLTLDVAWGDYTLPLPPGWTPDELHAVQFVIGDELPAGNRTIKVDELRLATMGSDPLRLAQSYRPGGWAASDSPPESPAGRDLHVYPNRAFLYDQATTIIALLAANSPQTRQVAIDMGRALLAIANADGSYFNERVSGHVLLGDGAPRPPFSQLRSLGDNAWIGIAFIHLFRQTGQAAFLNAARKVSDWAESELKNSGPLGGYRGGFNSQGKAVAYRSTEHNLDLAVLNRMLAHELGKQSSSAAVDYHARYLHAANFVLAMFDNIDGKFWIGTTTGDTTNQSSVPLDTQLWTIAGLAQTPEFANVIDWRRPLAWAEANLRISDGPITGFRYSTGSPPDTVWLEGTAHAAVVYGLLGEPAKRQELLQTLEVARTTHPAGDGRGIVAASRDGLVDATLGDIAFDARLHLSATAWAFLAAQGDNPFAPLAEKIERLAVDASGTSIAAHFDEPTGVLSLQGPDTVENFQRVLATLTYDVQSSALTGERRVEVTISDGDIVSAPAIARILLD